MADGPPLPVPRHAPQDVDTTETTLPRARARTTNMETTETVKSVRKMVMARHVSSTAWLILSLMRSSSESRSVPRKIYSTVGLLRMGEWGN
jgi:hypothetical protein